MLCEKCNLEYDEKVGGCPRCTKPIEPQPDKVIDADAVILDAQVPPQGTQTQAAPQPQAPPQNSPQGDNLSNEEKMAVEKYKGMAIGSLVCGIISLVLILVPVVNLILAIIAVVFGGISRNKLPKSEKGMATAGFVCGLISLILVIAAFVILAILASLALSMAAPLGIMSLTADLGSVM